VTEISEGYFVWEEGEARARRYDFTWLPASEAYVQRTRLGIKPEHFLGRSPLQPNLWLR
jgi:hypothetical protein